MTPLDKMPDAKPKYKKADWNKYSTVVENQLQFVNPSVISKAEIDILIMKFISAIRTAEAEAIPMKRSRNKKPKISLEAINLIKLRNDTRRQWQRCTDSDLKPLYKSLVNAQNKGIKKLIRRDFNKKWNNSLKTVTPGDKKLCSLTKKMLNKNNSQIEVLYSGIVKLVLRTNKLLKFGRSICGNHCLTVNDHR